MNQYVVAIAIDKVQTALYNAITERTQDSQTNDKKLQEILNMSNIISKEFSASIRKRFDLNKKQVILGCSGVCIFSTTMDAKTIKQMLRTLFEQYYVQYNGTLFVKYVFYEADITNSKEKLAAIGECKRLLKKKECVNHVMKENQELLFQFTCRKAWQNETSSDCYDYFVNDMNELCPEKEKSEDREKTGFRIAVIKADLDGMGKLFEGIDDYDTYSTISGVLSEKISHPNINHILSKCKNKFKVFPLYFAGDDIFFAVQVKDIIPGVQVCCSLLNEINGAIEEAIGKKGIRKKIPRLSLSIGIDITITQNRFVIIMNGLSHRYKQLKTKRN